MESSKLFQYGAGIEWDDLGNGVQRKIYGYDQQVMMVVVRFDTGAIGELHEHMHSQVTYVESGVFEMTMGEKKAIIKKGDGFYVPPHVVHGVVCLEPGILIDTFSPHRADFLAL